MLYDEMPGTKPIISVVICTYNRSDLLEILLHSMGQQTLDPAYYEIIVIDNNSTDATAATVEKFDQLKNLRYILELKQGLSHARNRGWREALGEYVAYVDDDCKVPEGWLTAAVETIKAVEPGIFGGPYYAYYLTPKPEWYQDSYGSAPDRGPSLRIMQKDEYLDGGNLFIKRKLLESIGGFDTKLGMSGSALAFAEETELLDRVRHEQPNTRVYFAPATFVYHLVRPEKMTWRGIIMRAFFQGRSLRQMQIKQQGVAKSLRLTTWFSGIRLLLLGLVVLTKCAWGFFVRDSRRYPYFENYVYAQLQPFALLSGKVCESYAALRRRLTRQS